MKKSKLIIFIMILFLGMFFIMPAKVFAANSLTPGEWYNHISQFDYGYVKGTVGNNGIITIEEEPSHEYDGWYIIYISDHYEEDSPYFEPALTATTLATLIRKSQGILWYLQQNFDDFDGFFYWNFEEQYWQVEYYISSDFDNNNNDNNNNKEVDMVTDLLDTLAEIGAGIGDLFGKIVESVGQFFYTPGTGDNPGSFTIVGILTIAAVVVSLSMWVLRLILRLFKLRG
jgi:hypothetical protein